MQKSENNIEIVKKDISTNLLLVFTKPIDAFCLYEQNDVNQPLEKFTLKYYANFQALVNPCTVCCLAHKNNWSV